MQLVERDQPKVELRLTAMIDIVFLLIIFFMTVSQMNRDVSEKLALPVADQGNAVVEQHGRVIVNVTREGTVIMYRRAVSDEELIDALGKSIQAHGADGVTCVLRVDRFTRFAAVQRLLRLLAGVGVWRVSYAVVEQAS